MAFPALPARASFSLAARVRVMEDEDPVDLEVRISAPRSNSNLAVTGQIEAAPGTVVYDGKKGILVTFQAEVLITYEELVTVDVVVNGAHARRLAFDVVVVEQPGE